MASKTPQILVVEDEPGIAELLRFALESAGFSLHIAADASAARAWITEYLPQLILLDWMLPDMPGLDLLRLWRNDARTAKLPVIMLTAKSTDEDKVAGLNAGADDYVTKPFSPRELVARIQVQLRRHPDEPAANILAYGIISMDAERRLVTVAGTDVALDQSEFKLLHFLLSHPDRIFSRSQLLDKVWGDQVFIEERTVDVHIMRLRKALGPAAEYVRTVRSVGYSLAAEART